MARARDHNRDKAYELWIEAGGQKAPKGILSEIAQKLGKSPEQIRKWKSSDKWEESKKNVTVTKSNVTIKKEKIKVEKNAMSEEREQTHNLTEKQKLFCIYYMQSFNATQSAIKAGYSRGTAMEQGYQLLQKPSVKKQLTELKELQSQELMLDTKRILNRHAQIAFSDIKDFIDFDSTTEEGEDTFRIRIKDSIEIDGTLIKKISRGPHGPVIELEDRGKSLEFLTRFLELDPKIELEKQKLELEKKKLKELDDDYDENSKTVFQIVGADPDDY